METVTDYYNEVLNITLTEFISPNVMKIAEKSDQCELGRLLQLILGSFPIQIIVFISIFISLIKNIDSFWCFFLK